METKRCYVVTSPELGWGCVLRVYQTDSEEEAKLAYASDINSWIFEEINEEIDKFYEVNGEDSCLPEDKLLNWIEDALDKNCIVFHSETLIEV